MDAIHRRFFAAVEEKSIAKTCPARGPILNARARSCRPSVRLNWRL